jgi:hypothetical protein
MGLKELYDATDNRGLLNKAYKLLITRKERICNYCPYHRGENAFRKRKDKKNWKRYRLTKWRDSGKLKLEL